MKLWVATQDTKRKEIDEYYGDYETSENLIFGRCNNGSPILLGKYKTRYQFFTVLRKMDDFLTDKYVFEETGCYTKPKKDKRTEGEVASEFAIFEMPENMY